MPAGTLSASSYYAVLSLSIDAREIVEYCLNIQYL